ncbi:hypothetical protein SH584_11335 [Sphingomonas sp. LY29]|uniref:hypothetical protein n=1 Tax=Sphingomonas sp. LY29 TaxID=3095341 RepID=UPI002D7732BB|nr:hypothetical protein [Sphingomonas sp. LY29]WRP25624.1 hypothetical protein SH584_11335 [Sphingomonas sp. LY29]
MGRERQFRVELTEGQPIRVIDADVMGTQDDWLIFYHKPPQGGVVEYWRVAMRCVVSIETIRVGRVSS